MSRRPRPPGTPRPRARDGLHPAAVGVAVVGLAAVALGVGWLVGSAGPGVQPAPPEPATGGADAPKASGARALPVGTALPTLSAEDQAAAAAADAGAGVFRERCARCHTIGGGDREGPDLARAALRHDVGWVRALVDRPDSMFRTDSVARGILRAHGVQDADAWADDPDVRALLAYLRSYDRGH